MTKTDLDNIYLAAFEEGEQRGTGHRRMHPQPSRTSREPCSPCCEVYRVEPVDIPVLNVKGYFGGFGMVSKPEPKDAAAEVRERQKIRIASGGYDLDYILEESRDLMRLKVKAGL